MLPGLFRDLLIDACAQLTGIGRALEAFGAKYADEWGSWGPRFRDGLADGSRVLLRYRPLA